MHEVSKIITMLIFMILPLAFMTSVSATITGRHTLCRVTTHVENVDNTLLRAKKIEKTESARATEDTESWFSRGKAEADKGIPNNERVTGIAIVVFSVLMVLYFVAHQMRSTGFFTSNFGTLEMIMLYGSWVFWIISSGLEGVLGQRLLSRLVDTFGGIIFVAVATAWLLVVFPFDFAYFADVLPDFLRFLVQWISNDIARVVMVLYIIGMGFAAVYAPIAYGFVGS